MSFPISLDIASIRQVVKFTSGTDKDMGRLSYAIWDLSGYGLGTAFGDVNLLSGDITPRPMETYALSEEHQVVLTAMVQYTEAQNEASEPPVEVQNLFKNMALMNDDELGKLKGLFSQLLTQISPILLSFLIRKIGM